METHTVDVDEPFTISLHLASFAHTARQSQCVKQILEICNDRLSFSNGSFVFIFALFFVPLSFSSLFFNAFEPPLDFVEWQPLIYQ